MIGLEHYLAVAATLFIIGVFGLFLNRKNVIILLMSIELMLLAVNIQSRRLLKLFGRSGRAGLYLVRIDGCRRRSGDWSGHLSVLLSQSWHDRC